MSLNNIIPVNLIFGIGGTFLSGAMGGDMTEGLIGSAAGTIGTIILYFFQLITGSVLSVIGSVVGGYFFGQKKGKKGK